MTKDNIQTRRHYAALYWNWPTSLMLAHLNGIDEVVDFFHPDELLAARELMDEKIPLWK